MFLVFINSDKVSKKSKEKVLVVIDKLGYVYNCDVVVFCSKWLNLVVLVINDLINFYLV